MKQKSLFFGCVLGVGLLGGATTQATVINAGFETGDFTGWSMNIPVGGQALVLSSYSADPGRPGFEGPVYSPVSGNYFAVLKTDGPGSYTTASQWLTLAAGETLSGYAAFDYSDFNHYDDTALVAIADANDTVIALPWYAQGSTLPDYWDGPWTSWTWTAPAAGVYHLIYGVKNATDGTFDSKALFDSARVSESQGVPDAGGTLMLFGLACSALGAASLSRIRGRRQSRIQD